MFKGSLLQKLTILCMPIWLLALPSAPTDLVLIPSLNSVEISWADNSNDETGFKVYRDDVIVGYTQAGVHAYVDSGLEESRRYKYTIKATDDTISTSLTFGVGASGIADKDNYSYYKIEASAGDTVTVNLHNMDANGDLYVNIAQGASKSSYTCKSENPNKVDDSCSVTLGSDETIYIAVYAAKCINNVQHHITATITHENAMLYGQKGENTVLIETDNDNYKIYYPEGIQNAPVVVFISGYSSHISRYTAMMEFMASHGYYVIGFSSPKLYRNDKDKRLDEKKLVSLLNQANADTSRVSIMGHSYGGGLAFSYLRYIKAAGYAQASSSIIELDGYYAQSMTPTDMRDLDTTSLIIRYGGLQGIPRDNNKHLRSPKVDLAVFTMLEGDEKALLTITANNDHHHQNGSVADANFINQKQDLLRPVHAFLDYTLKNIQAAKSLALKDDSEKLRQYNGPLDNSEHYEEPCQQGNHNYCNLNSIISNGEH